MCYEVACDVDKEGAVCTGESALVTAVTVIWEESKEFIKVE